MKTLIIFFSLITFNYQNLTDDLDKAVEIIKKVNCELPGAWTLGTFETGILQKYQLSGQMDMLDSLLELPDITCIVTSIYNHSCEINGMDPIHMLYIVKKDSVTEAFVKKLFIENSRTQQHNSFFETKNFLIQFDMATDNNETCQNIHPLLIETLRKFFMRNYKKL